jgi:hypothetical protein
LKFDGTLNTYPAPFSSLPVHVSRPALSVVQVGAAAFAAGIDTRTPAATSAAAPTVAIDLRIDSFI